MRLESVLNVTFNYLTPELHTLVVVLLAQVVGGKLQAGDDIEELRWFPMGGPLPELAFEADRMLIEEYARSKNQGLPVDAEFAVVRK